jgi:ATP-dependent Lon protease
MEQERNKKLPLLAMRGIVLFPNMILHFDVGRKKSIDALNQAMDTDRTIFLVTQKDILIDEPEFENLYKVGVVAKIKQLIKANNETVRVLVEGVSRAKISSFSIEQDILMAEVEDFPFEISSNHTQEIQALIRTNKGLLSDYLEFIPKIPKALLGQILTDENPTTFFENIVHNILIKFQDKQALLEQTKEIPRLKLLAKILKSEAEILGLEQEIYDKTKGMMDKGQRDYFLREQLKVISNELGDGDSIQDDAMYYADRIERIKNISVESREKLLKECERLYKIGQNSHEATVIRSYLETCIDLPWDKSTKDKLDIQAVKQKLDKDHYGIDKVKERILESLSVRKLSPDLKGQIICLVGPPGVGKTSIAKSVANAIGRKYVRISLGGVRDESDIRGHRKTYIGAMSGRIINAYIQAKSNNPLVLLDEIDKMGSDFRGDPSSAMLEVLDSEQNVAFRDHYIEVPFDLSNTFFLTTANTLDTIPAPLLDRMEIIELSGYTREERFNIAKRHLIKKQLKKHGLKASTLSISDDAIYSLVDNYSKETGVRKLERDIAKIMRKTAMKVVNNQEKKIVVNAKNIEEFMGAKKYKSDKISRQDEVGVVNGLAWTRIGGVIMPVEVAVLEGEGKIELTGSLGDVMKESAKIAISYVRRISSQYGIEPNFHKTKDIHIHFPEGAVPKDGPSAGVAITTAIVSALANIPAKSDFAMTGEVTLRGKVMEIGGLKEKAMGAYTAGIKNVIIPEDNASDISEFDDIIKQNIKFIPVKDVSEVLELALLKGTNGFSEIIPPQIPIANPTTLPS